MKLWETEIYTEIVNPIAKKAIDLYGKEAVENGRVKNIIDVYPVTLLRNDGVYNPFYQELYPHTKGVKHQINVEVKIGGRIHVSIWYTFDGVSYIEDRELKRNVEG